VVTKAVADAAWKEGVGFYSTYGWHPVSVAATLANLKYWSKHRVSLLANVATQGDSFRARLSEMKFRDRRRCA
jgi:4-aminobutyrate aminotransferase-like enzyme